MGEENKKVESDLINDMYGLLIKCMEQTLPDQASEVTKLIDGLAGLLPDEKIVEIKQQTLINLLQAI